MKLIAKPEILGFRHEALSRWHRSLGPDFPAVDLDFPLVEYDRGEAVALIEFRLAGGVKVDRKNPNLRAIAGLATKAGIPCFFCRYPEDLAWFRITPLNNFARVITPTSRTLTQREFEKLLSDLRSGNQNRRRAA